MSKIQLTFTSQEEAILTSYGNQLGYSSAKTAKFFVTKAIHDLLSIGITPVYPMSKATETKGLQALADHRAGKTHKIEDVNDFIASL